MTKVLTPTEKFKMQRNNTNTPHRIDYTTIAAQLRTVSWSSDSHPTGVVKTVYGIPTFQLTLKLCNQKNTHLKIVNNHPYKDRGQTANQSGESIKLLHKHVM